MVHGWRRRWLMSRELKVCMAFSCEVETENPRFCSRSCSAREQHRSRSPREPRLKPCERSGCGIEIDLNGRDPRVRFCSHSCAAQHNNRHRTRTPTVCNGGAPCEHCGEATSGGRQRRFCSSRCATAARLEQQIAAWLAGEWDGNGKYSLSKTVRTYLMTRADYRCQSPDCAVPGGFKGVNPASGRSVLQINHIDGDASNSAPANLEVLCPNCHSMTSTFGALNRGKSTRSWRYAA